MPIFQQLFRSLPSWPEDDSRWYSTPFQVMGDPALAGRTVTKESALAMSAMYACITILSNSLASLSCYIYERMEDGSRRRATERVADRILTRRPNGDMSVFRFFQVMMAHLTAWGNHYSYVERDDRGIRNALWPIFPDLITPRRNVGTHEMEYVYRPTRGDEKVFTPWEIFHVPGFGYNGLVGKSPVTLAREAVGLGLAQEEFGARFYGDGTHPGLVAVHPGSPKPETMQNLREALLTQVGGLGKSHRLLMLQDKMELKNISINPVDAEFLVSRRFQLQEICRFYRMPPHMIADMERATFSNIEHQSIEFVMYTLGPWLNLLESEFSFFFLTPDERKYFYFEFLVEEFLRGDIKTRYAAYQVARNSGWMNADEIRRKENMEPMPDGQGEIYIVGAGVQSLAWLGSEAPEGGGGGSPVTPAVLMKELKVSTSYIIELRERAVSDARRALSEGLAGLEERMTRKMSEHAVEFNNYLAREAANINTAFDYVVGLEGERRTKEAAALMAAFKGVKTVLREAQKQGAAEQQRMWETLKTLPGISDSVNSLRDAIAVSIATLEAQIEDAKSSITSASGKLNKRTVHGLQELNDLAMENRARLEEGLTQLSESSTIEDAIGELRSVVTATQEETTEKLGGIRLDIDPVVAAFTKSWEEVDIRFTAVEEAIRAGVTPKMLQGVVHEKFSEGIAGLLHRLDSVEGKLADIVPEDVVKSIVSGESQAVRDLIVEGQQVPLDLSPMEDAIKSLSTQITEGQQVPLDLSILESAIKDLGARLNEMREDTSLRKPVDLEPVESAIRGLGTRLDEAQKLVQENRHDPVDLSPLEKTVNNISAQITENRQEPADMGPIEGAVKDLGARLGEVRELMNKQAPELPDLSPVESAIKDLSTQITEGRQEPVDLSVLESAVNDLSTQITESSQEPADVSQLEGAIKSLGAQLGEIHGLVRESGERIPSPPKPVDLSPLEDAIKDLGTQITEGRRDPVDLSPLDGAIKELSAQITEGHQEPIDLSTVESAIKDLSARLMDVRETVGDGVKLPDPIDLSPMEKAIKDLGAQSGELHGAVSESASNQMTLVASIDKIVSAQTQVVEVLRELRSDSTDRGKEWAARSNELGSIVTGLQENMRNGLEELSTSVEKIKDSRGSHQDDHSKRIDKLEKCVATRVVANREKVNSQYLPLIQDTMQFILNRECIAVRRALKKFAGKREEMVRWLDDFYNAHPEFISLKLSRLFSSFLEALYTEVAIEGGLAGGEIPEGFDGFIRDHFDEYVVRHMEASYGYLKRIAGNESPAAAFAAVDTWHNERAAKVAVEELGRAGEAIMAFVEDTNV